MDNEIENKRLFAKYLIRTPDNPFAAAKVVFPAQDQVGIALEVAQRWVSDAFVLAEQDKLLSTYDAKAYLPTKEMQAKDIYAIAKDDKVATEDRLKAHKQYSELMGFIEKPAPNGQINVMQGVIIVKDHGSDDEWEKQAVAHQRALTGTASYAQ